MGDIEDNLFSERSAIERLNEVQLILIIKSACLVHNALGFFNIRLICWSK